MQPCFCLDNVFSEPLSVSLAWLGDKNMHLIVDAMQALAQEAPSTPKMISIDSAAGGGKTFLLNLTLALFRSRGQVAIATATTGIAATLLAGGATAHSRFGIPVPVDNSSVSNIKVTSERAAILRKAVVIIWDEVTMADKLAIECADRLLREIMSAEDEGLGSVPFGGKLTVFSGTQGSLNCSVHPTLSNFAALFLDGPGADWRQLLPVVKHGSRAQTVNATLKRSSLWPSVKVMKLTRNMRVESLGSGSAAAIAMQNFSTWLLEVGSGFAGNRVVLPREMMMEFDDVDRMIDDVFPNLDSDGESLNACILLPLNKDVNALNLRILNRFQGPPSNALRS